jgi:signal transduction histidine kinase
VLFAVAVYGVGAGMQVGASLVSGAGDRLPVLVPTLALLGAPVVLGCLLGRRVPDTPVAAALVWMGAAPSAVFGVEAWGATAGTAHSWPAASFVYHVQRGAWVWNLAGFAALCLVFPDGLLPGRRWRRVVLGAVAAAAFVTVEQATVGVRGAGQPLTLPTPVAVAIGAAALVGCLSALAATVASLVVRYRRGTDKTRQQLRWLMLGAGTVPLLLAAGWGLQALGASPDVAYLGLFGAMLVLVPAAVIVAVLRYDLFDVDRLLGVTLAWLLTTLASAAMFAVVVAVGGVLGAGSRLGVTGAAFVTALVLLPMHRRLNVAVGRVVDRDRYLVAGRVQRFVDAVRAGTAEPEQVEEVFRAALADPHVRLLLRLPGGDDYADLAGESAGPVADGDGVPLRSGDTEVGVLVLGPGMASTRRLRRAREVAFQARLPIEVSRLRLHLRQALRDVQSSRARLVAAAAEERRLLERDLHDGAQQQIVSVGMRLRSTQRRIDPTSTEYGELDAAVEALEATIAELRRLAHGIRPERLDDGLPTALGVLVADAPVPVRLTVSPAPVGDTVATTAYFVVAEAYTNALKHAQAGSIAISVVDEGTSLRIEVADDGVGGANGGFTSVRDRVASLGGTVRVVSPPGAGTRVVAEIPDAHRRG